MVNRPSLAKNKQQTQDQAAPYQPLVFLSISSRHKRYVVNRTLILPSCRWGKCQSCEMGNEQTCMCENWCEEKKCSRELSAAGGIGLFGHQGLEPSRSTQIHFQFLNAHFGQLLILKAPHWHDLSGVTKNRRTNQDLVESIAFVIFCVWIRQKTAFHRHTGQTAPQRDLGNGIGEQSFSCLYVSETLGKYLACISLRHWAHAHWSNNLCFNTGGARCLDEHVFLRDFL